MSMREHNLGSKLRTLADAKRAIKDVSLVWTSTFGALIVGSIFSLLVGTGCSRNTDHKQECDALFAQIRHDPSTAAARLAALRPTYDRKDARTRYLVNAIGGRYVKNAERAFVGEWCYFVDQQLDWGQVMIINSRVTNAQGKETPLIDWIRNRSAGRSFELTWEKESASLLLRQGTEDGFLVFREEP